MSYVPENAPLLDLFLRIQCPTCQAEPGVRCSQIDKQNAIPYSLYLHHGRTEVIRDAYARGVESTRPVD